MPLRLSNRSAVNHPAVMRHYSLSDYKADNPHTPETEAMRQYRASLMEPASLPRRRRRLRTLLAEPYKHARP